MKGHLYMALALLALLAVGCAGCEREEGGNGPAPSQAEADSPEVEAGSPVEDLSPEVEVTSPGAGASFSEGEEIALRYRLRGVEEADLEIYLNDEELEIGNGQMLPSLPAGEHSLRLSSGGSDLYRGSFHVEQAPLVLQLQVVRADNACWPKRELRSEIVKPSGMSWKDFLSGMLDRSPEWGEQVSYWKGEAKALAGSEISEICYGSLGGSTPGASVCFSGNEPAPQERRTCFDMKKRWDPDKHPAVVLAIKEEDSSDGAAGVGRETIPDIMPVAFTYRAYTERGLLGHDLHDYDLHDGGCLAADSTFKSVASVDLFGSSAQFEQFLLQRSCGSSAMAERVRDKVDFSKQAVLLFQDSVFLPSLTLRRYPYISVLALLRSGSELYVVQRLGYHDAAFLWSPLTAADGVALFALIVIDRKDYEGVTSVESIRLRSPKAIARE